MNKYKQTDPSLIINYNKIISDLDFQKKILIYLLPILWIIYICLIVYFGTNYPLNVIFSVMFILFFCLSCYILYSIKKISNGIRQLHINQNQ